MTSQFKWALFCANQARTIPMKGVAGEAWRLAIEYRDEAAKLGEPPNIGDKPRHVDEAQANSPPPLSQEPTLIIAKGAR